MSATERAFCRSCRSGTLNILPHAGQAILDEDREPLSGFGAGEAVEIYGDEIERTVSWKHGTDVNRLAGRPIRLKFVMKDADLYSIQFQP